MKTILHFCTISSYPVRYLRSQRSLFVNPVSHELHVVTRILQELQYGAQAIMIQESMTCYTQIYSTYTMVHLTRMLHLKNTFLYVYYHGRCYLTTCILLHTYYMFQRQSKYRSVRHIVCLYGYNHTAMSS